MMHKCKNCGSDKIIIIIHNTGNTTYSQIDNSWVAGLHKDFKPYLSKAICSNCAGELEWSEYKKLAKLFRARIPFTVQDKLNPDRGD